MPDPVCELPVAIAARGFAIGAVPATRVPAGVVGVPAAAGVDGSVFERAATEAFTKARYQPALKWNQRVKSQITFEVRFFREDAPPSPDKLPPMVPTGPLKPAP